MNYREAAAGGVVLALRLLWIPARQIPADWIAVMALFWIAQSAVPEPSRARPWLLGAAGLLLTAIYAAWQAPSTRSLIVH